ncbi:MAG TPA: helix-turn-helix domain-containing protein, partial [Iamia sp.]|nr:helix-turn-helix domain-containing protein [Iamia sp.]
TRAPVELTDARHDPRAVREAMHRWNVQDMLGVPLLFDDAVIGIIYIDDPGVEHHFTRREVRMAETFASLASLALRQTSLYAQLERRTKVIDNQKQVLERLSQVHRRLTRSVLSGADIPDILRIVVELVNKPVILHDPGFEVVGWAAPDAAGLTEPPRLSRCQWILDAAEGLNADQPSVILPPSPSTGHVHRRLLCELVIDDAPAGYLEVVELGQRISMVDVKVAEHATTVLSLVLLSQRQQAASEGQAREDYLNDLLVGGRDADTLARRAPLFGLDVSAPHAIVRVLRQGDEPRGLSGASRRARWSRAVGELLGAECRLSVSQPGADVFLIGPLEGEAGDTLTAVRSAVEAASRRLEGIGYARIGAVSGLCRSVDGYPQAHRDLCEAIDLVDSFGWETGVVLTSDLGMLRLFVTDGQRTEAIRFAHELLDPLVEYDQQGDGQLLPTLRAYLAVGAHARAAATELGVHENTVRYRLGRVKSVAGIDVEVLDHLLDVRLAVQVLDLSSSSRRGDVADEAEV